jgi:hypothetical protein
MYDFKVFILLAFCSHRKHIEHLNNRMNISAYDTRLNSVARKLTNDVRIFRIVILKQHTVLLQQGNQQSYDSQQMACEVLTDNGHTLEDSSGPMSTAVTEPTDGILCGTARQRTDCRRQQWT